MHSRLAALFVLLATSSAGAEIVRSPDAWTVSPPFAKSEDARTSLSGAACVTGTNQCLVVNDEKKYAQFFQIVDRKLSPGRVMRLLPDSVGGQEMKEIDAEAAAYAPPVSSGSAGHYYVIGSHGRSRKGALRSSTFNLFRFAVDPASGQPTFPFGDDEVAVQIERTNLLRETIKNTEKLAAFAEQPLEKNGVTVEGMAVRGSDLWLGLRGPSNLTHVMRVRVEELFKDTPPTASLISWELGVNVGIRDMASVSNGILLLTGRGDDGVIDPAKGTDGKPLPAVWFWVEGSNPKKLGDLPGLTPNDKAETLLVLEETSASYKVLVLFDGAENGRPVEFVVDK